MDKSDRETRDFMNVESFSQLPFIRPAPKADKLQGAIRLFGKEFDVDQSSESSTGLQEDAEGGNSSSSTSSRKFECHYCCRNFPTSQALGGHQNAHKRERQQAKRAHLQSAMVHAHADAHVYGQLMNYTRLGTGTAPPPMPMPMPMPMPYHHSWSTRLYGGSYQPQPINGSPLALWRIPAAPPAPLYGREHRPPNSISQQQPPLFGSKDSSNSTSSQLIRFGGYESKPQNNIREHVSLDLHL